MKTPRAARFKRAVEHEYTGHGSPTAQLVSIVLGRQVYADECLDDPREQAECRAMAVGLDYLARATGPKDRVMAEAIRLVEAA